jgi:PAS domain S-box-containing protein
MRRDERAGVKIDFGGVVDALPALVWTTLADGRSDFVNRGWRDYTGLDLDDAIDLGWQRAIHPDDLASFVQSWDRIRESGIAREIDARLRRSDGEYRWFVFRPSPLPENDDRHPRWCWLGSFADEGPTTDERLRRLWDMLPFRSGFLDSAGVLEWGNLEGREKTHGETLEAMRDWRTSKVMLLDDHDKQRTMLTALLTKGEMFDMEVRMRHKDGAYRWARARAVPIRDAQGNAVRYLSCQFDIHDLKQAEALLAAEVELLEMVARGEPLRQILVALSRNVEDLSKDCFCSILLVAKDRRYFEVGAGPSVPDSYEAILNGKTIDKGYDPCSLAVLEKARIIVEDLIHDPRWVGSIWPAQMEAAGYSSCWSEPIMSVSGEASGVITIYRREPVGPKPQEQDLIDRFAKIAGIAIDRADADAALQARERELREVLAQLTEGQRLSKTGSFTWDVFADRHNWSEEIRRTFGFDLDVDVKMDMIQAAVHPEDMPEVERVLGGAAEGRDFDLVFRVLGPDGEVRHAHVVGHRVAQITDRPVFLGALQDVTENKVAEEALNCTRSELAHVARVATLNAMTASIAHEVSQPLSGILINANTIGRMLAANPPNLAGAAETTRRAIRDANRATEVIRRLRAMFSSKAPAMEIGNLNDIAREVIALSMGELRRNGALLQTDFADGLPVVNIDRVQLQQVILNLLLNAADAMAGIEDRARTLLVQTGLDDDGSVKLIVRDSGTGIDPATIERLFDAFYTTKEKGMGVGLSISRSIIARHEGRLWAEANEGPGATFSFCLPVAWDPAARVREDLGESQRRHD